MLQKGVRAMATENSNVHAVGSASLACSSGLFDLSRLFG